MFLALAQGQIDATVVTSTVALATVQSGHYPGLIIGGDAPYPRRLRVAYRAPPEWGLLNYLDLFVQQQVRTGRYDELFPTGSARAKSRT